MSFAHGRFTVITVATKDLSAFTDNSEIKRRADVHQTTTYGVDDHTNQGGLRNFEFTMSGTYDNTIATSPRGALVAQVGATLAIVRKPEGTGTGKPQESFSGVLADYTETSPVADMVKWQATFTGTGSIATTSQT